jgi:hypothetical protein
MSDASEKNSKGAEGNEAGPPRSFDSSVTGPGSQIGPFRIEQELGRGGARTFETHSLWGNQLATNVKCQDTQDSRGLKECVPIGFFGNT